MEEWPTTTKDNARKRALTVKKSSISYGCILIRGGFMGEYGCMIAVVTYV